MSRVEVLEFDIKKLSSVKKPPTIRISPYWNGMYRAEILGTYKVKKVLIITSVISTKFHSYLRKRQGRCSTPPIFSGLLLSQLGDTRRILLLHAKYDEKINIKCISLQHFQNGSFMNPPKKTSIRAKTR